MTSRTRRWVLAALALPLLPLLAACGDSDPDPASPEPSPSSSASSSSSACASPSESVSASACSAPGSSTPASSAPASSSPASSSPAGPVRALFFGDSYFVGGGYTEAENSMGLLAAGRLGWDAEVRGAGGTGFVDGNAEHDIPSFLGQIQAGALDVGGVEWLVIEGGGNDRLQPQDLVEQRATEVLAEAAAWHPEARLVLVGTLDPTPDDFSDSDPVTAALEAAAANAGVPFISAQRWLEGRADLVGPDFDHPLPEGHQLLGQKLAQALRALR